MVSGIHIGSFFENGSGFGKFLVFLFETWDVSDISAIFSNLFDIPCSCWVTSGGPGKWYILDAGVESCTTLWRAQSTGDTFVDLLTTMLDKSESFWRLTELVLSQVTLGTFVNVTVRSFMFLCLLSAHFYVGDHDKEFPIQEADSSHSSCFSIEQPKEGFTTSGYILWKEETWDQVVSCMCHFVTKMWVISRCVFIALLTIVPIYLSNITSEATASWQPADQQNPPDIAGWIHHCCHPL